MKRCFVALSLPASTRRALVAAQQRLPAVPSSEARSVRPTKPDDLHLTLKFLGATPDEQVPVIAAVLRATAAGCALPDVLLAGVGAFPRPDRPRAVFAAVTEGRDEVIALVQAIEEACAPLGFPPEERPRVPHVTLFRVDGARRAPTLESWMKAMSAERFGAVDASAVVLYESRLQPGGSVYTELERFPLGEA